jgi:chemotaxis protein MotB
MARSGGKRRRARDHAHENEERWLLTYSDMITLLMALFMVLFSISSVNISKYKTLQQALRAAFSGNILPGGRAIEQPGATANSSRAPTAADIQSIVPLTTVTSANLERVPSRAQAATSTSTAGNVLAAAQQEQGQFQQLEQKLNAYANSHGLGRYVHTTTDNRGLVIKLLTDRLLFRSGSATLNPTGGEILAEIAGVINVDRVHPVAVDGNTDNVPIQGSIYPSNWELSTARASTVVRSLISNGVDAQRLSATGFADTRPVATNSTTTGQAQNRRVEVVLQRLY